MNSKRINNITDIKLKILSRLRKEINFVLTNERKIILLNENVDLNEFIKCVINTRHKMAKNDVNKATLIIEKYAEYFMKDLDVFKNYYKFKKFLNDNNCYDEFIKHLRENLFAYTMSFDKSQYFLFAFMWNTTISGADYWRKINDKWEAISN